MKREKDNNNLYFLICLLLRSYGQFILVIFELISGYNKAMYILMIWSLSFIIIIFVCSSCCLPVFFLSNFLNDNNETMYILMIGILSIIIIIFVCSSCCLSVFFSFFSFVYCFAPMDSLSLIYSNWWVVIIRQCIYWWFDH